MAKKEEEYTDFSNVETQRSFLTAEEFPEGSYGTPKGKDVPVENKNTPWREHQTYYNSYGYEFRNLHQDLPRQFPEAHHTHDEADKNEEEPYT
ncbi:cytosolic protein [Alkalihalobacillus oceani]|uniref:Cytosolic protein n=1 Tax=Halalkalibacter oceani TaxID=1653776 RepID=A0A9X2DRX4_9BACI|nr:cytosolic protein [Halalkalibacter oceani]MCM3714550.1 cytosolic protein [Halalkalibacter oceani]